MSVPAKRVSKRRTRSRRAHQSLDTHALSICPQCRKPVRPHYTCSSCGYYRGRNVLHREQKVEKKLRAKKTA